MKFASLDDMFARTADFLSLSGEIGQISPFSSVQGECVVTYVKEASWIHGTHHFPGE